MIFCDLFLSMSSAKYSELILEAIDQLRKRKARPDSERICHILSRRHGLKHSEINQHLSKLVDSGVVIKVDYKGSTSYRNAAKWSRRNQYFSNFSDPSDVTAAQQEVDSITSAALEAVDVLSSSSPEDRQSRSVSFRDIEQYLLNQESKVNINISSLRAKLEKEVKRGSLSQLPNGDYVAQTGLPNVRKRVKTGNSTSSSETSESLQDSSCDYCLLGMSSNRKGVPEKLLTCLDCNAKAHPGCLDYLDESAEISLSSWLCPDCKTCTVCSDSGNGESILICSFCDKGFHKNCHSPPLSSKPSGQWFCSYCNKVRKKNLSSGKNQYNTDSCDSFASDTEVAVDSEFVYKKCLDDYPSVIPLADDWSIREVEMFFKFIGYHAEAPAFREQEIDGQSLLLMKRSDVLTGLSIKLGPALKIYSHIKRLQTVQPDEKKKQKT